MKLDKKDIALVNSLSTDSRMPFSDLAKKTGMSRELTTYRFKKLKDNGLISACVALPNLQNLGFLSHTVYVRFGKISNDVEKSIIKSLVDEDKVSWVAVTGGAYDLAVCILSKSLAEFDRTLSSVLSILGDSMRTYVILNGMDEGVLANNLFEGSVEPSRIDKFSQPQPKTVKTDDKDEEILRILSKDARISLVDISQRLDIPANTVSHRIKRLKKEGAISHFVMVPNYEKLGLQWNIVLLRFMNFSPEQEAKFHTYINQHPYIDYFIRYVGVWNYQISVISKDASHLRSMLLELKNEFGDMLQEYETITVFKQHKYITCMD